MKLHFGDRRRAFLELKRCMTGTETLAYFDASLNTRMKADMSPHGLGAVLVQEHSDIFRPFTSTCRSVTAVELPNGKKASVLVWARENLTPMRMVSSFI